MQTNGGTPVSGKNPSTSTSVGDPEPGIIDGFSKLSTPEVSDALDALRPPGSALGIRPILDGFRLVGRAFTVRYVPADLKPGTVGDYLDDVAPGSVVVLDNAGRVDCTV